MKKTKQLYESLKEDGVLLSLHPTLSGEWEKDKIKFKKFIEQDDYITRG